jgi:hypothetical protein
VIAFILAWRVPEFPLRSNFTPIADDDTVDGATGPLEATPVGVHV